MCTLALYLQHFPAYPLIVAANRDEFYERPASGPRLIAHDPWVVAGQDLLAGGTWLGVNQSAMIVGVLNRRGPGGHSVVDPARRSRGLLALEMLQQRSVSAALACLREQPGDRYNGFNLLIAAPHEAYVAHNGGPTVTITALDPGVHLLTNLDVDDATCPRIAKSARLFQSVASPPEDKPEVLVSSLREILSDHSTPLDPRSALPPNNLCVHTPRFGTCSASILAFVRSEGRYRHWYADGPPCTSSFTEVPLPN